MASPDIIEIIISAKDMASGVIAKAAAETKMASAEVNSSLNSTSKEASGLAGALGFGPTGLAIAAGVAATALGVEAVKAAGDFQQQLTKLTTSAGESVSNLGIVSDGIKKIAIETGASTTSLADGMYKVSSAGFHGADGLNVLKAAEQGAKAEGANLETVADAVSSALIDYHLRASDAADVTSKLVAATASGKMRFEELAGAMPAILPIASAAHVSLSDILGDMASMTVHGMSAQQSAENLADTIRHMVNPTAQQAKELAMLGMTTTQLAGDLQTHGLSGTLQEISSKIAGLMAPGSDKVILDLRAALSGLPDQVKQLGVHLFDGSMSMKEYSKAAAELDPIAAKQAISFATLAGATHRIGDQQMTGAQVMQNYTQALAKATGDSTGLNVALMLTGENAGTTNAAIRSVSEAAAEAGGNVKGWAEIQKNFNQQMAVLGQVFQVGLLSVGQWLISVWDAASKYLIPVFGVIKKAWDDYLMPAFNWISGDGGKKTVEFFGIALAGAVILVITPIVLLGAATMGLIAIFNRIGQTVADVAKWLGENIPKAVQSVISWWQRLVADTEKQWSNFTNGIKRAWDNTAKAVSDGVNSVIQFFLKLPETIPYVIGLIAGSLARFATVDVPNFINSSIKWFQELPGRIGQTLSDMWGAVVSWFSQSGKATQQGAQTAVSNATGEMQKLPGQIGDIIAGMWGNVVHFFTDFGNNVANWAKSTVKGAIDEFGKLPGQVGDAVSGAWNGATGAMSSGWNSFVSNMSSGFSAALNHHALGTNFAPGGLTMVGENGPELVNMPTGSKVYNARETQQMVSGGGNGSGVTINGGLHIHNNMDEERILARMGMRLRLA